MSAPTPPSKRLYTRTQQNWAVDQERARHDQALYMIGEYALFVLLWTARDYDANLVGHCPTCASDRISAAYGQAARNRCPDCYGTTFTGGYRALIVRPCIFTDADDSQSFTARGVVSPQELQFETTSDFRIHSGDYVMRATGERLQMRAPQRTTIRTGFGTPYQRDTATAYNLGSANVEDAEAVAYLIPPDTNDLITILNRTAPAPVSFADVEVLRAPLIPLYERD
ncbi:hypothetical protein ACFZAM_31265 [Streptomyces sp. NPDC008079]|uniref:hypothetical protein n=1 Tax=Streptomyces sp. NPDC008079 TaxID=3364806 RepID=UPI0036EF3450